MHATISKTLVATALISGFLAGAPSARAVGAGELIAWGDDASGQLGDSNPATTATSPGPVQDLKTAVAVAAGANHSLAVLNDGRMFSWGEGSAGALGSGTAADRPSPLPVRNIGGVVAIAGGLDHSLAAVSDGTVYAWGIDQYGQLGNGPGTLNTRLPGRVTGVADVVAVSGGTSSSLALRRDGAVFAWGRNFAGQLGDGTRTDSHVPVEVTGLPDEAIAVAAGWSHSLALMEDGTVVSWGSNSDGQLGGGTSGGDRVLPRSVDGVTDIVAIAAGLGHSLAVRRDGTVLAWGSNAVGQLGDGTTTRRSTPVVVNHLGGVVGVAAGSSHSLAVRGDGTVAAWGSNFRGQLGNGGTADQLVPVEVIGATGVVGLTGGFQHSLALGGPARSDLVVGIRSREGLAAEGSDLAYSISVMNAGPATATGIILRDPLPSRTTFVKVTSPTMCTAPPEGSSGTVTCRLGPLAPGITKSLWITARVVARGDPITNRVDIRSAYPLTADPDDQNNTAAWTVRTQ